MRKIAPLGRWLRLAVILGALGSVAVAGADVTWRLMGHDRVMPPVAVLRAPVEVQAAPTDLGPALMLAPFGAAEVPVAEAETPEAPLNLILLGVIVRDHHSRSLALLRSDQSEGNYRIGEEVAPGVTLTAIAQNRVTLSKDGADIVLYFAGAEAASDVEAVPTGAERLMALITSGQGGSISEQVDAAARAEPITTQDYIDMWRKRIIANPAQVLDTIGLVPGEKGYTIAEKHDVGVSRAGLRAGDIVTRVNGQSVGNVDKDRALYDVIADSGLARIELERDGRTIVMSFPLQ
ncbi:type II secretion system protein N [Sulfitobacter sp. HNIBRBA3233]|uniref:type II secretion system protein N n=1 Tax=Sulfitobacter marinivivus TaxID=3158558 RepID=UPI0032E02228